MHGSVSWVWCIRNMHDSISWLYGNVQGSDARPYASTCKYIASRQQDAAFVHLWLSSQLTNPLETIIVSKFC